MIENILRNIKKLIKRIYNEIILCHKNYVLNEMSRSEPIFILGVQKSGTTAIAALLAQSTGLPVTLDITRAISRPETIILRKYGLEGFDDFLYRYRKEFSKKIVKEPALTFDYQNLKKYFPKARFVMIMREPKDNIRSILNRLKIPGSLQTLESEEWPELKKSPAWRINLDSYWLGYCPMSYVDSLAFRWKLAAEIYLNSPDEFILVKYEDFLSAKKETVSAVAKKLDLEMVSDLSGKVDKQYQPKGKKVTNYNDYFGENIALINSQCGCLARKLGY